MPQNLEIRVLFCYSPEVLQDTYPSLEKLIEDNETQCIAMENILNKNIDKQKYIVRVICTSNIAIKKLQQQWHMKNSCLNKKQLSNLARSTSSNSFYMKLMLGSLPQQILNLQKQYGATVTVLQTKLCDAADGSLVSSVAAKIGISQSSESVIAIARSNLAKNKPTYQLGSWIMLHELGHLMGCRHPYGSQAGCDPYVSNSHGHWVWDSNNNTHPYGTLMSYADQHILYYSNPNICHYPPPFENTPCGKVGESEAYKTVNANIQKLAGIF